MGTKILVCDDDHSILEVTKLILEEQGYEIIVDNGKSLFEKIRVHKPQLILLDVRLGSLSGADLAKKIKTTPDTKNIPIILFSASYRVEAIAQDAKVDGYLKKPFQMVELEDIVKKHLFL